MNKFADSRHINHVILLNVLFPFLSSEELLRFSQVNKTFHQLVKTFKMKWKSELEELSIVYHFDIPSDMYIDFSEYFAHKRGRKYHIKDHQNQFIMFHSYSIFLLSSDFSNLSVKEYFNTFPDKEALCGMSVKRVKKHFIGSIYISTYVHVGGSYKMYFRTTIEQNTYYLKTIQFTVEVVTNEGLKNEVCSGALFQEGTINEIFNYRKKNYINRSKVLTSAVPCNCLRNIFLTNIEICEACNVILTIHTPFLLDSVLIDGVVLQKNK